MNFDAVIFDCDGVLVDSEAIHVAVELELLAELGLHYEHAPYVSRFVGLGVPEFLSALAQDYADAGLGRFPEGFHPRLEAHAWPRIEKELKALPGITALVTALSVPVAVASSTPTQRLRRKLDITGLSDLFDPHVYSADQVPRSKPAPDLFLLAAEQLNVAPARCLVIEDSLNGVRAGRAAGMTVLGYTGGGHADDGLCTRLLDAGVAAAFDSHNDIMAYLG